MEKRLGKQPRKYDSRTLKLHHYFLHGALPVPPAHVNRSYMVALPNGMMMNDQLGDCTCAAMGHAVQLWTAANGSELTVPDSAVLKAYEDVGGYKPGDPSTDNGAMILDVMKYWKNTGVGGHKALGFASIEPDHADFMTMIRTCIDAFGVCYIGVQLPKSAQNQPSVWSVTQWPAQGDAAPGSWGGHAVVLTGYTSDGMFSVFTWGEVVYMTEGFLKTYCDEAYAVLSPDWIAKTGYAPVNNAGLNIQALTADLAII